jgi:hypothetical protein
MKNNHKYHKYTRLSSGVDAIDGWWKCTLKRDDGRIVTVKEPRFNELLRKGRIEIYGKENRNI